LEILNLQNNKLTRVPEEALEAIVDTATVIDILGKSAEQTLAPPSPPPPFRPTPSPNERVPRK